MRKLLVLLVALVAVAAFASVRISGSAWAKLEVTFSATPTTTATPTITSGGNVRLVLSGNVGQKTGFVVSFGNNAFSVGPVYVWENLYKTDALSIKYRLGALGRGTEYVTNSGGAFALDFDVTLGDIKDNLSVFVYPTGSATMLVDLDVWNRLNFTFVTLTAFARGVLSAGANRFPELGLDATIDLAKALNIQGATLSGYTNLRIDPNASGLGMLPNYRFGVNFEIDKLSGGVWFRARERAAEPSHMIGASVETTVLDPVTIGGGVTLPVNLSDFSQVELNAYARWPSELLRHEISLSFKQPRATVAWTVRVSF